MPVATSEYTLILIAVQNVILGLNLDGAPGVVRRKHPLVSHDDTLPIVIVSPGQETYDTEDVENSIFIKYPVLVTIAHPGNMLQETDVDVLLNWRQAIRESLHVVTLTQAPDVFDCQIELDPPFDPRFYQANVDKSAIKFIYVNSEPRHA